MHAMSMCPFFIGAAVRGGSRNAASAAVMQSASASIPVAAKSAHCVRQPARGPKRIAHAAVAAA
ncbi:hypothetical protein BCCH1_54030 [Burkholderia contaminans]|uniref:Uncharacterized protein n=1 Tax=Burkholderia contaminans TaxID=488447 RepID=A0A250LEA4_9BURK|nr:hypothetical protein BCCH1_54030 [Burkholderia contaminans]GLZ72739.1 hypothetical protein Bcon01_57840 [Burkholderia contaminans]